MEVGPQPEKGRERSDRGLTAQAKKNGFRDGGGRTLIDFREAGRLYEPGCGS